LQPAKEIFIPQEFLPAVIFSRSQKLFFHFLQAKIVFDGKNHVFQDRFSVIKPVFSTRQQKRMFWRNAACAPRLGRGLNESRVQHDRGLCFQIFLLLTATYGCRHDYSFIIKSVTATRVATHVMSSSLSSIFVHVI
jgi:hypothetical protein